MKKILLPFLALGGLLFASSCQMDEPDAGTLTGEVDFTITVGIPGGITTYSPTDRASFSHLGGANNVDPNLYDLRYILKVYDDETLAYEEIQTVKSDFAGEKVNFSARLLAKKYTFVLWADFVEEGTTSDLYYDTDDLTMVSYSSTVTDDFNMRAKYLSSDAIDAYTAYQEINLSESSQNVNISLKRPFGKIRLLATDTPQNQVDDDLKVPTSATIAFTDAKVPTTFNALTGEASESEPFLSVTGYTFTAVKEPSPVVTGHNDLAFAYLLGQTYFFESPSSTAYKMTVTVKNGNEQIGNRELTNIPVSANKLTTVIGNFYTNEGNIEVIVDDEFNDLEDVRAVWDGSSEEPTIDDNAITIHSAEQLAGLAKMVNEGKTLSGYTVTLNTDIDLNNQPWTPIGTSTNAFQGTFDGNGHTINNLEISGLDNSIIAGLFGKLNGTVKDLVINNAKISHVSDGSGGIGVVAGSIFNTGLIENVTVSNAEITGNRWTGGIVGYMYGSVENCKVSNIELTVTPDNLSGNYDNGDKVGGIVGLSPNDNRGAISGNHAENVTIKGYRDLGGIAGAANASALTGNTASNITITVDQVTGWYSDETANAGIILGRKLDNSHLAESNVENGENNIVKSYLITEGSSRINSSGVISFNPESNSTYYVAAGEYEGIQVFSYSKTNVSMIAEGDVTINGKATFGTHSNYTRSIPENSLFRGFTVNGELRLDVCGKVVAENNKAAQLTVKTYGLSDDPSYTSDITLTENTIDGTLGTAPQEYGIYIVPNVTGYKLTVEGNTLQNVGSHGFVIQGNGDGSATTTIGEYSITGNTFESWGLGEKENRGAVKVWADTEIAPEDLTGSSVNALSEKAKTFVNHILDKNNNNTFPSQLLDNCCIFEFYGFAFDSLEE